MPGQEQVYCGIENGHVREPNPIDSIWQHGTSEPYPACRCIDFKAEACTEQHGGRAGCPCLWRTRDGIERGRFTTSAMKAANQFRKTVAVHGLTQIEHCAHDSGGAVGEP